MPGGYREYDEKNGSKFVETLKMRWGGVSN